MCDSRLVIYLNFLVWWLNPVFSYIFKFLGLVVKSSFPRVILKLRFYLFVTEHKFFCCYESCATVLWQQDFCSQVHTAAYRRASKWSNICLCFAPEIYMYIELLLREQRNCMGTDVLWNAYLMVYLWKWFNGVKVQVNKPSFCEQHTIL